MTIAAGDLKKIDVDLTKEPTKEFDYELAAAKGGNPPVSVSFKTLLRSMAVQDLDETGKTIGTIDFTDHDCTVMTINANYLFRVSGIDDNEVVYLHVIKGASNTFTIDSSVAEYKITKSYQNGLTELFFRITAITKPAATTKYIFEPLNNQSRDSLIITDLTSLDGTVSTFNYFESTINNNICAYEGSFTFTTSGLHNEIEISIANWNVLKDNSGYVPMNVHCFVSGLSVLTRGALIKEDTMIITLNAGVTSDDIVILVSGTFKVI